jgi:hypothetical protein
VRSSTFASCAFFCTDSMPFLADDFELYASLDADRKIP